MKKIHTIFFIAIMHSCFAYANDSDKLNMLEQEVQRLTNDVELLRHEVSAMKNQALLPNSSSATALEQKQPQAEPAKQENKPEATKPVSERQTYEMALVNLRDKNYTKARSELNSIIEHNPKSPLLDKAMFWYAETFFRQKDFQNSSLYFLKCYKAFPKGEKAADCLLKLASSLSEVKGSNNAEVDGKVCKILDKLDAQFPQRSAASKKTSNDLKAKHNCHKNN